MSKSWYSMRAARDGSSVADIGIFNDIGAWGVSAVDFNRDLRALGTPKTLHVRINTDGGDISHGFAIFNMLAAHPAKKIVTVMGLAASMGSVIAMAGDEVRMPDNAMIMIHDPWGGVQGSPEQITSFGEALSKMRDAITAAYVKRTGLSTKKVAAMMAKETWLTAEESVTLGFADEVIDPVEALNVRLDSGKYKHAPSHFGRKESPMGTKKNGQTTESDFELDDMPDADAIRAQVLKDVADIQAACKLAGKPELADKFVQDNKSLTDVVAALAKLADEAAAAAAEADKGKKLNARRPAKQDGDTGTVATISSASVWDKWNKRSA